METFFALIFFISSICFVVGIARPVAFKFLFKERSTRLINALVFGLISIVSLTIFSAIEEPLKNTQTQPDLQETPQATTSTGAETRLAGTDEKPSSETAKKTGSGVAKEDPKATNQAAPKTLDPSPQSPGQGSPINEKERVLAILKTNATTKWGDNYQMVKFEYDNQVEAYNWVVAQTKHTDILDRAKNKWGYNYEMVKYEYENQTEAYLWIESQTEYPEIMNRAKQKWSTNYEMVKYEYEQQVEAYKQL